jgi:hypothetical protein
MATKLPLRTFRERVLDATLHSPVPAARSRPLDRTPSLEQLDAAKRLVGNNLPVSGNGPKPKSFPRWIVWRPWLTTSRSNFGLRPREEGFVGRQLDAFRAHRGGHSFPPLFRWSQIATMGSKTSTV